MAHVLLGIGRCLRRRLQALRAALQVVSHGGHCGGASAHLCLSVLRLLAGRVRSLRCSFLLSLVLLIVLDVVHKGLLVGMQLVALHESAKYDGRANAQLVVARNALPITLRRLQLRRLR